MTTFTFMCHINYIHIMNEPPYTKRKYISLGFTFYNSFTTRWDLLLHLFPLDSKLKKKKEKCKRKENATKKIKGEENDLWEFEHKIYIYKLGL